MKRTASHRGADDGWTVRLHSATGAVPDAAGTVDDAAPAASPRTPWRATALRSVALLAGLALFAASPTVAALRTPSRDVIVDGAPVALSIDVDAGQRPTPTAGAAAPLGVPRRVPDAPGAYDFLMRQPSSDAPVAYDPCRPVPYVVNERTAPPGAERFVRDAVEQISEVTGLRFVDEGTTDELVGDKRPPFQRQRYGDRWAPILITWSDPSEIPILDGDVAGVGASTGVYATPDGPAVYVSGLVALDGPQVGQMFRTLTGRLQARGLILHELGHLVGLAHVDDPAQLMHGHSGTVDLQSGDIAGLVRLGAGECVDSL